MLTSDQINIIALDMLLGRPPSIEGEEADKLREDLAKDIKLAKENDWEIELPFDVE